MLVLEQPRHDDALDRLECLVVAEEAGDPDQQIAEQQGDLVTVHFHPLDIGGERIDAEYLHAALHAAQKGLVLVPAEIMPEPQAEQFADADARSLDLVGTQFL